MLVGPPKSGLSALFASMYKAGIQPIGGSEDSNHLSVESIDRLLIQELDSNPDMIRGLPENWIRSHAAEKTRGRIRNLLSQFFLKFGTGMLAGSSLCRTLPVWIAVCKELDIEPRFIVMTRHPWETARSLSQSRTIDLQKGILLWLSCIRDVFAATHAFRRSLLTLDQLVANPISALIRAGNDVDLVFPKNISDFYLDILNAVKPELRHHYAGNFTEAQRLEYALFVQVYRTYCCLRTETGAAQISVDSTELRNSLLRCQLHRTVERLFDKVFVISLEQSTERRAYIQKHLPEFGIQKYEFFNATSANDPLVTQAYANNEVAAFPPCFRCGKHDCGNPDCNNFLIPQQVATFITYKRLWQTLADGNAGRILIIEDDVRFHDHIQSVLTFIEGEIAGGRIPFQAEKPCLIRLGWALCDDHVGTTGCSVNTAVKMANPCHAITREYAKVLLSRYTSICHTVDEYQHRLAARQGEAFTVFPPIASELSWSNGVLASTIHPKAVRSEYLRSLNHVDEADANDLKIENHIKKKYYRSLLITGHPRCGTGYAAGLCRQLGVDVGHEKLGTAGISSWMFAVDADLNPYSLDEVAKTRRAFAWRYLVMPVRNLANAAGSVIREFLHAPKAYGFLKTHIQRELGVNLDEYANPLDRAVWSVTSWVRIILRMKPDMWFRIEDGHSSFQSFLIDNGLTEPQNRDKVVNTEPMNADKLYKGVRYPKPVIKEDDWKSLLIQTWDEIQWYNAQFGYNLPATLLTKPSAFTHLIMTRFNVKQLEREPASASWLEKRFSLFDKICYPSVRNQTNQNFKWLVFFDEDTPVHIKSKIQKYAEWINFIPIYTKCETFFGYHFPTELKRAVMDQIDTPTTYLITTRLDNDDAIHYNFVQMIQNEFAHQELMAVNFEYGWQLHAGKIFQMRLASNPYVSLIERYDRHSFKTVYVRGHGQLSQICPIHNISNHANPAWIQVIHGDNLVNNCCYGKSYPINKLEDGFDSCMIDKLYSIGSQPGDFNQELSGLPVQREKTIIPFGKWNEFTDEFYKHSDSVDELREVFRKYRNDAPSRNAMSLEIQNRADNQNSPC